MQKEVREFKVLKDGFNYTLFIGSQILLEKRFNTPQQAIAYFKSYVSSFPYAHVEFLFNELE